MTLFVRTPELRELRDLLSDTLTTLTADTHADGRRHRRGRGQSDRPGGVTAPDQRPCAVT